VPDSNREKTQSPEWAEWSRHYDTLTWVVITIFSAAVGGLLAFSFERSGGETTSMPDRGPLPEIAGLALTLLGVYYVAGFRRARARIHGQLDGDLKDFLAGRDRPRVPRQWTMFNLAFLAVDWFFVQRLTTRWGWPPVARLASGLGVSGLFLFLWNWGRPALIEPSKARVMRKPSTVRWLRALRVAVFALGNVIAVGGWLIDRSEAFPWLTRVIAPKYAAVKRSLDRLDVGEAATLDLRDPGARVLLEWWQPAPPVEAVSLATGIGRSTGIFNVRTGKHRYELRLLTDRNTKVMLDYVWNDLEAKERMRELFDTSTTRWSGTLLVGGLLLAGIAFAWERRAEVSGRAA
jgi:hypothetical protein